MSIPTPEEVREEQRRKFNDSVASAITMLSAVLLQNGKAKLTSSDYQYLCNIADAFRAKGWTASVQHERTPSRKISYELNIPEKIVWYEA